jgi:hypothetical protein
MVELTPEQVRALEHGGPVVLLDPATRAEFVIVPREMFEKMRKLTAPLNREWDDPALDVYEQYRKNA